ncbi:MAG: hypothetical protein CMJ58_04570 [Planctomycetaceae bacterium]|nr:hypothetical protein [Planctomycetaceae bacterium]
MITRSDFRRTVRRSRAGKCWSAQIGRSRCSVACALFAVTSLATAMQPAAAEITSQGDVSLFPAPGSQDSAYVGQTSVGRATIDNGSSLSVTSLNLGVENTAVGLLEIVGTGSQVTAGRLSVGQSGLGVVTLDDGGRLTSSSATVGKSVGRSRGGNPIDSGYGEVVVQGAGSIWTVSGEYGTQIGKAGPGKVVVTNGGRVVTNGVLLGSQNDTSSGHIVMQGPGASWNNIGTFDLGTRGVAEMDVLDGATLLNSTRRAQAYITTYDEGQGRLLVSGPGARWAGGGLAATGISGGNSRVEVTNGGSIDLSFLQLAGQAPAEAPLGNASLTLSGQGSYASVSDAIHMIGASSLSIRSGATMATPFLSLRPWPSENSATSVLIDGQGSKLSLEGVDMGNQVDNPARFTIRDGGVLEVTSTRITFDVGTLYLDGGTIRDATFPTPTGGVSLINGGLLSGSGTIAMNLNHFRGEVVVAPTKPLEINGNLRNSSDIWISEAPLTVGKDFSQFDDARLKLSYFEQPGQDSPARLSVAGEATLSGTLSVVNLPVTPLVAGDAFPVLEAAGGVNGTFSETDLPALEGGLDWLLDYQPQSLTLRVVDPLSADFNGDRIVGAADLAMWQDELGMIAGGSVAVHSDATADGQVTGSDFLAWQRQATRGAATGAASAIPEPGALWLALGGLLALAIRRPA